MDTTGTSRNPKDQELFVRMKATSAKIMATRNRNVLTHMPFRACSISAFTRSFCLFDSSIVKAAFQRHIRSCIFRGILVEVVRLRKHAGIRFTDAHLHKRRDYLRREFRIRYFRLDSIFDTCDLPSIDVTIRLPACLARFVLAFRIDSSRNLVSRRVPLNPGTVIVLIKFFIVHSSGHLQLISHKLPRRNDDRSVCVTVGECTATCFVEGIGLEALGRDG